MNNHTKSKKLRRSGGKIMASLISLLGSLSYIMVLAVINGSLGFVSSIGITVFGAVGVAKALGEPIALSYGLIIGLTIGFGALRGVLRYLEQYGNHYIAFKLLAVLRDKIFSALRRLAPAKLESKKKGSIIAMITSDIETLEVFYAHTVSPVFIALLVSVGVLLFVGFVSSWYLSLVAAIAYICLAVVLPYISSSKLKEPGVKYRREFASFNAYFLDSIKGIKDIVLNNAGAQREQEVNRRSDILLGESKKMKDIITRSSAMTEVVIATFTLIAAAVGAFLVITSTLTVGKMIIGLVAVFSSFGPVLAVSALPGNLNQTFASGDRVLDLLEETPSVQPVTNGKNFTFDGLEIKDLDFSYEEGTPILKDVYMHAQQGEIIGIVGDSGSGKSTLLKLMLRFWQKGKGEINYSDIDIDAINTQSLIDNVTMVSQSTYLFDESIEDNLRIAKPDATDMELEAACKLASVHDFITTLPESYKTRVGMFGDNLSAGEKQRIGLARAFLSGSELILLDEPTSNVDSINEGIILQALINQKHKKSIILVSHRESTMAVADRIYRIENGKISERVKGEAV